MSSLLYDLISKHYTLNSQNIAIILEDGRTVTYEKLKIHVENIYNLIYSSLSRGDENCKTPLVGILMTRDIAAIASILSVLKCGAAYVPVDPTHGADRQSYIFQQSNTRILIADEISYKAAQTLGVKFPPVLVLDPKTLSVVFSNLQTTNITPIYDLPTPDEQLSYVLYTSGSTGNPKGVMVKQVGVVNCINWFADELMVNNKSRVLGLTTFCFDISVLELFIPLTRGATLALAKSESQKDPFLLLSFIERANVNVVQATPTSYGMMMATGWNGNPNIDFLVGGEPFSANLKILSRNCKSLRNVYGPTETTIWSTSYTIPHDIPLDDSVLPIGLPISETNLYVVSVSENSEGINGKSQALQLVNYGEEGELCIGGIGLAEGYLGRPDLTENSFILDPFQPGKGMMLYRTGDLVKQLPNNVPGGYTCHGRIDSQVKRFGLRIELGEIETVIKRQAVVEEAVVIERRQLLVAYVEPKKGISLQGQLLVELKTAVASSLTYYMMPESYVIIESFPKTSNFKIDKKALPDPPSAEEKMAIEIPINEEAHEDMEVHYDVEAFEIMENHICDLVYRKKSRRPRPTNSLGSIGIDSIGSIAFITALSRSLGNINLQRNEVFGERITIRALAKSLLKRLRMENLSVLERMGISIEKYDDAVAVATARHLANGEVMSPMALKEEESFDTSISKNTLLLDGMLGFFALLVLLDHFHSRDIIITLGFTADTSLFMILTGFRTAITLRDHASASVRVRRVDSFHAYYKYSSVLNEALSPNSAQQIVAPKKFDVISFLYGRAQLVFPFLWLGLLIYAPQWYLEDKYASRNPPPAARAGCDILYVLGLQYFYRPTCRYYGPNGMVYASILWTTSIIYAGIRVGFTLFQNALINLPRSSTFNENISRITFNLSNNHVVHRRTAIIITLSWLTFLVVILSLICFLQIAVSPAMYVTIFIGGVATASCAELLYQFHWIGDPNTDNVSYDRVGLHISPESSIKDMIMAWLPNFSNEKIIDIIWRFLPDGVIIALALFISPLTSKLALRSSIESHVMYYILIPLTLMLYLLLTFLQRGRERLNLSRFYFEMSIFRILGTISYPLYLYQYIFFDFYVHLIADSWKHKHISKDMVTVYANMNYDQFWFQYQNNGIKFVLIILYIVLCWLLQKYFYEQWMLPLIANLTDKFSNQRIQKSSEDIH